MLQNQVDAWEIACAKMAFAFVKGLHTSLVAHQAGAYPGFCSMKQQRVFLLSPGWKASPSQGYPQQ